MNLLLFHRVRILLTTLLVVAGTVGGWYGFRYRPRTIELTAREAHVEATARANNEAVLAQLRLGTDGIREEIERARRDARALSVRVPDTTNAAGEAVRMRQRISESAIRNRVVVTSPQLLEPSTEGSVRIDGMVLQAVGRYADIEAFLGEILAMERTTRLAAASFTAVPDPALAVAGGALPAPAATPVQPGGLPALPPPVGTPPFTGNLVARIQWFSLIPSPEASEASR